MTCTDARRYAGAAEVHAVPCTCPAEDQAFYDALADLTPTDADYVDPRSLA